MALAVHGDRKYQNSERLSDLAEWSTLSIEHRRISAGPHNTPVPLCTEIVLILGGGGRVSRSGDGQDQESVARPGMSYLVPAGTQESKLELSDTMECLHLYLPSRLVDQSALTDYEIDPAKAQIAYLDALTDPTLFQIGAALQGLLNRPRQPTDSLFVDGMQVALAAHLLGKYAIDRWHPPARTPSLDPCRLKRVLDYIEVRLGADIRLQDLAAEACLSPFHFARLFRDATGLSPHRYVTHLRVQRAQEALALARCSLVEIALSAGFGSQANFTRAFRNATGLTPGQYRELHRR